MKRSLLATGLFFSTLTAAQSLSVEIDYASVLDVYYYFRRGEATAALNDYGIEIEANYSSNAELCSVLGGAQLVYSTGSDGDTLLAANCDSVYHLVDAQSQVISWDACQEFSFYSTLCPSVSSSSLASASSTSTSTSTSTAASLSISSSETFVLTTVTTTIDGLVTSYTSYCPLSGSQETTISSAGSALSSGPLSASSVSSVSSVLATGSAAASSSTSTVVVQAAVLETKTYVYTDNGSVTSYTSLIAVSGNGESKTFVSNTDYYKTTSSQAASAKSTESSILSTVTTTKDNVLTTYTTYCPLSSSSTTLKQTSAATEASGSYSQPALTTVYTTINGVITSYTTYCPLSAETAEAVSATLESASETPVVSTQSSELSTPTGSPATTSQPQKTSTASLDSSASTGEGTVLVASSGVTTTNTSVESATGTTVKASSQMQTAGSSASSASSVESARISVYEAGAGKAVASVSLLYFASFIMGLF